jgi:hypothetical protein
MDNVQFSKKKLSPITTKKLKSTKENENNKSNKTTDRINSNKKAADNRQVIEANERKGNMKVLNTSPNHKHNKSVIEKVKYPQNINEYRHLMDDSRTVQAEMAWILDLRGYKIKNDFLMLKHVGDTHPRLYADYIEEFIKKNRQKNIDNIGSYSQYNHLVEAKTGATANSSQFGFETTLRNFRPSSNHPDWRGASAVHKPRLFSSYNLDPFLQSKNFNSTKTTLRTFEPVYDVYILY